MGQRPCQGQGTCAASLNLKCHFLGARCPARPQGKDPVGLLQEALQRRFRTEVAAAQEQHARALARLRERCCAAHGDEAKVSALPQPLP